MSTTAWSYVVRPASRGESVETSSYIGARLCGTQNVVSRWYGLTDDENVSHSVWPHASLTVLYRWQWFVLKQRCRWDRKS